MPSMHARRRVGVEAAELNRERRAKTVVVTTTPGFAGLWLIPRLADFTAAHP